MRAALRYQNDSFTPLINHYTASGSLLSIGDYSDDTKVGLCLVEGCLYEIYLILSIHNSGEIQMDFETLYTGGRKLNSEQRIESMTFYYRTNKTLVHTFDPPIIVNETKRQNITIRSANAAGPKLIDLM